MEEIKTLEELRGELTSLEGHIRGILRSCAYRDDNDLDALCLARNVDAQAGENLWTLADEMFLRMELSAILYKLNQALDGMDYINGEILAVGKLRKMASGRYALSGTLTGWPELRCGDAIEVLVEDDHHRTRTADGKSLRVPYWRAGRIAHNGTDFYFTNRPDLPLEGLSVRIRG